MGDVRRKHYEYTTGKAERLFNGLIFEGVEGDDRSFGTAIGSNGKYYTSFPFFNCRRSTLSHYESAKRESQGDVFS